MASPAIEPLLWTPLLFLRCRALFDDPLAASIKNNVKGKISSRSRVRVAGILTLGLTFSLTDALTVVMLFSAVEIFLCAVALSMRLSEPSRATANSSINGRGYPSQWHVPASGVGMHRSY